MNENIKKILIVAIPKASASLGGPIFQTLLLSSLPLAAVGKFNLLLAIAIGVSVFARGGLDILLLRESSHDWRSKKRECIYPLVNKFTKKTFYRAAAIVAVMLVGMTLYGGGWYSGSYAGLLFVTTLSFTLPAVMLLSAALKSINQVILGAWLEQGQIFFISSVLTGVLFGLANNEDFFYLLAAFSSIVVLLASFCFLKTILNEYQEKECKRYKEKESYNEIGLFTVGFVSYMAQWGIILIFGLFYSEEEVGVFSSALRFGMVLNFVLVVSNQFVIPKISNLYRTGKIEDLGILMQRTASIVFVIGLIVVVCFYFVVNLNIMDIFKQYRIMTDMIFIVMLGQLVNISSGATGYLLSLTGKEGLLIRASVSGVVVGLLLMVIFGIYEAPILYAVVAYSVVPILTTIMSIIFIKTSFGFYCIPKFWK